MGLFIVVGFDLREELAAITFAFASDTLDVFGVYAEAGEFHCVEMLRVTS